MVYFTRREVFLLFLLFFVLSSSFLLSASSSSSGSNNGLGINTRRLLEMKKDQETSKKSTSQNLSIKNQTKLIKPNLSTKNQTKLLNASLSFSRNETIIAKTTNSTKTSLSSTTSHFKTELKKLNFTSQLKKLNSTSQIKKLNSTSKPSNSTKPTSTSTKKSSDLIKLGSLKNKTTKPASTKLDQILVEKKKVSYFESQKQTKNQNPNSKRPQKQPSWLDQEDENDLISEFRDLPSKFQRTLIPDLERISLTSKKYITKANKEMTKGFKPYVGNKYASAIASFVSFAFILIPLLLVSVVVNRIKAYFSLQKILIFIQVYLFIYFSILCLSSLVTGHEPLKFLYATSQSTYICVMVMQTLGYILYLLMQLMYLVLVFSTDCGRGSKILGLVQIIVGFAIGLHFYEAVFHRVVLHEPPKTNWKVHGVYATCFLAICLLTQVEGRKKAYLEDGGEEGKKN